MAYILSERSISLYPSASVVSKIGSMAVQSVKAVQKYVNQKSCQLRNFSEPSTFFKVYVTVLGV
jgi:hypothetical protein